jgi:hypothetical protein
MLSKSYSNQILTRFLKGKVAALCHVFEKLRIPGRKAPAAD